MIKQRYRHIESLKIMGSAAQEVLPSSFDVLVWNVFKCKKKGWQEDFKHLAHNKDIVLLQEAVVNSPFDDYFTQSVTQEWIMARSFGVVKSNLETGVKTGSRVSAQNYHFSTSLHGEPFSATKKMSLASYYPIQSNAEPLLVVNTHLINFVSFNKFQAHLNRVFHTIQQHSGPVLLAGDFNTWNRKRMDYLTTLASNCALEEVVIERQPKLAHLLRHLDHVYCRGLEILQAQVHNNIQSSDHLPISLSLRAK